MDRLSIIQSFLKHGVQINQGALDILLKDPQTLEKALKIKNLPSIITTDFLKPIYHGTEETEQLTINSLTQVLNHRYNFLRNILMNKPELVNLISINKIRDKLQQFSVIGSVFEKSEILILEDPTGQGEFKVDKELAKYIVEDEVVGAICERDGNTNKITEIIYPDIPMRRDAKSMKSSQEYIFISNLDITQSYHNEIYFKNFLEWARQHKNIKIIISGNFQKTQDFTKFTSSLPSNIEIHDERGRIYIGDMEILLMESTLLKNYMQVLGTNTEETIITLLKKRNLNPTLSPNSYSNSLLLENIPDIIIVEDADIPTTFNYKGITIAISGNFNTQPSYWIINLQTRETLKINFS